MQTGDMLRILLIFLGCFLVIKTILSLARRKLKEQFCLLWGVDRTWADYFRNLHPSDPLEPVCQHTGNGCDRRDRNLCTLVSVLSEYTAFCTE